MDNHRCPTHRSPSPGHHLVITVSHPHVERPSDLSVSAIQPWLLAMMVAAAAASVALVAGPVSAWTRNYVRPPATNEPPTPSDDAGDKGPQAPPATRTLKHPGLLESRRRRADARRPAGLRPPGLRGRRRQCGPPSAQPDPGIDHGLVTRLRRRRRGLEIGAHPLGMAGSTADGGSGRDQPGTGIPRNRHGNG